LDDYNKVAVNLEFNKLLVPTPNPDLDGTITPEERRQNLDNYRSIGWVSVYLNHLEMRQAVLAKKVKK
jgi:protoheme ferro-lyase